MQSSLEGRLDPEQHQLIECMNINVRVLNQPIDSVEQLIDVKPVILKLLFFHITPIFVHNFVDTFLFSLNFPYLAFFFFLFVACIARDVRLL
jgi:hypothetical protein